MRNTSIFPVLLDIEMDEIPVFIPTFNQPSLLRMTLDQFESYDRGPIVIYDNNSTYRPMIELLDELESQFTVIRSTTNSGPRLFTEDLQILQLMPKYFIVTDPDLIHNKNLPKNYLDKMITVMNTTQLAKVGFALEIYDNDEVQRFQDHEKVQLWENVYWQQVLDITSEGDPIYFAYIDSTFALNNKERCLEGRMQGLPTFRYPSARIAGNYTCQHVGWWKKSLIPQTDEEKQFYLEHQKWSHTEIFYYQ